MAQGISKSKPAKATAGSSRRPTVLGPKKGARTIVPRKLGLVRQNKLTKKYSAGLTASTERTLGARVGHLELLGGGKGKKTANLKENSGKKSTQSKDATKKS